MVGKGRKRREKNYKAAHGGDTRLPPPPNSSHIDVLPSKLRTVLSFTSSNNNNTQPTEHQKMKRDTHTQKKGGVVEDKEGVEDKKKKKRKRKVANDLRFQGLEEISGNRKRDRKKKYLEDKKKKKRQNSETELDFPGCEQVKFGDVVQAPPKLLVVPKKSTNVQQASRERLRLQAIEAYRNRKGWTSRPGLQLPAPVTSTPLL